jgi:hypothetical protein
MLKVLLTVTLFRRNYIKWLHYGTDTMYFVPEITGTRDHKIDVDLDDLEVAKEMFSSDRPLNGCSRAFSELAVILMEDNRLNHPSNAEEATTLYLNLLHLIEPLL